MGPENYVTTSFICSRCTYAYLMHMQHAIFPMYIPNAYAADVDIRLSCIPNRHAFFLSACHMHMRQIRLHAGIFLSTTLIHIQPTSQKAPMNDLNNPILLLFRHLVIAGKTQPSTENIGSYVDSRAFYIGICAASAITFYRDERVRPVYRLHMHRF